MHDQANLNKNLYFLPNDVHDEGMVVIDYLHDQCVIEASPLFGVFEKLQLVCLGDLHDQRSICTLPFDSQNTL